MGRLLDWLLPPFVGVSYMHVDSVKWFYLEETEKLVLPNGKYGVLITLRGKRDFEYNTPRCWTKHRLLCTVDGEERVYQFDEAMADEIIRYANERHHLAHTD